MKVSAAGFAPSSREILGLEPRRTMSGLRIEMGRGRVVTGQVVDGDGRPIREAEASLRPARRGREGPPGLPLGGPGGAGAAAPAAKGTSDSEGRFRIDGLVPGQSYSCVRVYRHIATMLPANVFEKLVLRPGEVRDVGDVRIKPPAGK